MNIAELDAAVKAVCPIEGVSVGRLDDRATWVAHFTQEATEAQRTAARAVLDTWDAGASAQREADRAARRSAYDGEAAVANSIVDRLRSAAPQQVRNFVLNNASFAPFGAANSGQRQILAEILVAVGFALRGGRDL